MQVQAIAREKNVTIPADMLETAGKFGLRASALNAYIAMQGIFFTGFILRTLPYFRDRILADPLFLFKVGAEVLIDSGALAGRTYLTIDLRMEVLFAWPLLDEAT